MIIVMKLTYVLYVMILQNQYVLIGQYIFSYT